MKRISSHFTGVFKLLPVAAILASVAGLVIFFKISLIPCLLFFLSGLFTFIIWWRYVRYATNVFVDDTAFYDKGSDITKTIPFSKVVSVYRPMYLRYLLIVITYEINPGLKKKLVIIPSIAESRRLFEDVQSDCNFIPKEWNRKY